MIRHAIVEIGKNPEIGKEYFEINSNYKDYNQEDISFSIK